MTPRNPSERPFLSTADDRGVASVAGAASPNNRQIDDAEGGTWAVGMWATEKYPIPSMGVIHLPT